jgi:hypothetical protein
VTILYVAVRSSFVVLAADRLLTWTDAGGRRSSEERGKIYVHARLPVAVAVAGLAEFDGRPVTEHVAAALNGWGLNSLDDRAVVQLRDGVLPRFALAAEADGAAKLGLYTAAAIIAKAPRGKADAFMFRFVDEGPASARAEAYRPDGRSALVTPHPALEAFYTSGPFGPGAADRGDQSDAPGEIARAARATIVAGIAEEARLGIPATAGEPIDVVVVDGRGARRV